MRLSLIALNARFSHSCPALFCLREIFAAALPTSEITLQQFTINDPCYDTLLAITDAEPDLLCFSLHVWNHSQTLRLVADLRRLLPGVPVLLGGPQAACLVPAELPAGCTLVRGEAEGLGPDFFYDLAANRLAGQYQAAPGPDFAMPYRPEDFAGQLANRNIYYESARGCPFACSYCLSSLERGLRFLPLAQVFAELAAILAHRPRVVRFLDRTFNADQERALVIWQWLLAQPGETLFHFEIAPDLFSPELLDFLATVPCGRFQFEIGLQSSNPATLAAVNRRTDLERTRENLRRLVAADNIHLHLDLILGLPFETPESFRASLNEAFAMAPHHLQMGLLKLLPTTPLAQAATEFGLLASAAPPYPLLANRWLSHAELARLHQLGQCLEAFHNNAFFRATLDHLRKSGEEPFAFFSSLLDICRKRAFFRLARTQDFLHSLLLEMVQERPDAALHGELILFDWFASGRQQWPPGLAGQEALREAKNFLWKSLPENFPPYYNGQTRKDFFKRALFCRFSGELLDSLGLASDGRESGYLCFSPGRRETGVLGRLAPLLFSGG